MEIKYETYEELLRGEIEAERYEDEIKYLIEKATLGYDNESLLFDSISVNSLCERLFKFEYYNKLKDLLEEKKRKTEEEVKKKGKK